MRKLYTILKRTIAVVLIISLLPLATFETALDNVAYAMTKVQEQPVELNAPEAIEGAELAEEREAVEAISKQGTQEEVGEAAQQGAEPEAVEEETEPEATEESAGEATQQEVPETEPETEEEVTDTEEEETEPEATEKAAGEIAQQEATKTEPEAEEEVTDTEEEETEPEAMEKAAGEATQQEVPETKPEEVEEATEIEASETEPEVEETESEVTEKAENDEKELIEDVSESETIENDMLLEESYLSGYLDEEKNGCLEWSRDYSVAWYEVYRDNVLLESIPASDKDWFDYYDTELQVGKQYNYRVEGRDENGQKVMITQEVKLPKDLVIEDEYYTLTCDETVYSVTVLGGDLSIYEHTLTVYSDFVMKDGCLSGSYDDSKLVCKGNLLLTNSWVYFDSPIELGGNMVATGGNVRMESLVLNGEQGQTINVDSDMVIPNIELMNYSTEGVHFASYVGCTNLITNECRFTHEEEGEYGYTLEEDVVIEGDYCLISGTLNLNGHSMTVRGDFIHQGGYIVVGNGRLLIEGEYCLEQVNNQYYLSPTVRFETGEGYIQVCGDAFFSNGFVSMYEKRVGIKVEGDVWIDSVSIEGLQLIGDRKQVVHCDGYKGALIVYIENHSEEGVFFTDVSEEMGVYENGCKVSYIDEAGTCGWKLEEDTVWSGDLTLYGGILDLNGYSLTITGDFTHAAGTLKVNEGTLCVEGDYRTQISRKQKDGSIVYERGIGSIQMINDNDRIIVWGDFILDTRNVLVGEPKGILELKGDCTIRCAGDGAYDENTDFGQIIFLFSSDGEQIFYWGLSMFTPINGLINRNEKSLVISGYPCLGGRVSDEAGTVGSSDKVYFTQNTVFEGGKWSGSLESRTGIALQQDLEILGTLYAEEQLSLNGKTVKAQSAFIDGLEVQKGRLIVEDNIYVDGTLTMANSEDYVFCGGDFNVRTQGEGIENGTIEIQGDLVQIKWGNKDYCSKVNINNTIVFSGTTSKYINFVGTLTVRNIINRSTGSLQLYSIYLRNPLQVTGICIDETGTVYGDTYIQVASIDQLEGEWSWSGMVSLKGELNLTHDIQIAGNLRLPEGGRLNGYSLHADNLTFYKCLYTDGGQIVCDGNLNVNGELILEDKTEIVYVGGNLCLNYNGAYGEPIHGGIVEVKGNVWVNSNQNKWIEKCTLVLSGTEEQRVGGSLRVAKLINRNKGKVCFQDVVYVTESCTDETGTVEVLPKYELKGICLESTTSITDGRWSGNVIIEEDAVLNQDLVVGGSLIINAGVSLDLNGHKVNTASLWVDGRLYIGTEEVTVDELFTLGTEGRLILEGAESKVLINGDFVVDTKYEHSREDVKGIIEVKGDVKTSQYVSEKVDWGNATLIFSGTEYQSVSRKLEVANIINRNTYSTYFSSGVILKNKCIDETGTARGTIYLTDTTYFENGCWNGSIAVGEPISLNQNLDVQRIAIYGGGILQLNGKEIHAQDVDVTEGTLDVQDGTLQCDDLEVYAQGTLLMQDVNGHLTIEKRFSTKSEIDHTGYLSAGILEIRESFQQQGCAYSFVASDEHMVLLNPKESVSVTVNNPDTFRFNNVTLNSAKKNYSFNTPLDNISNRIIVDYDLPVSSLEVGEVTYTTTELIYAVPADSGVEEYVIYRNGEEVAITNTTAFVDEGLHPGTKYVYEVYPRNDWGVLAKSSPKVEVTTKLDTEAPSLNGNLGVKLRTGSSITISWNAATDNVGVEGYTVYRDGVELATGITDTFYKDTTAQENTVYYYSITAHDTWGNVSPESNRVESTLVMPEITAVYPEPGKNIKADVLKLSVYFRNYENSTGNQVKIEYKDSDGGWKSLTPQLLEQKQYNGTTLYAEYEWDVTHVVGVKGYTLRYTVYDADGNKDEEVITYFVDRQLPKAPENVIAIADNGTIVLNWEPSVSEDCNGYKVYRKSETDDEYTLLDMVNGKNNTGYVDKKVTDNKEYTYAITTIDVHRYESEYSNEVTKIADADKCPPVVGDIFPKTGKVNQSVRIRTEASDNKEIASAIFYIRHEDEAEWTELGTVSVVSGKAEFTWETSLYEDGVYYIGVEALDVAGNRSAEKEIRRYQVDNTGIAKIILTEHIGTSTQVQIKWEDVTEADFSYFQVEQLKGDTFVAVGTVSDVLGYTVENLVPNTTYSFRVVGYDNLGNRGEPSEVCEVTTTEDTIKPTIKLVSPIASYYKDSLALKVEAKDNHALQEAVFSYSLDKVNFVEIARISGHGNQTESFYHTMSLRAFDEGSLYIKFEVYDSAGNKNVLLENGEEVIVEYVIDRTAPAKVEGLAVGSNEGYVELRWTSNSDKDIEYYRVYRADGQNDSFYVHKDRCNTKNYYDTSVRAGESYRYKVSAVDIAGNEGTMSEEIMITVAADTEAPTITGITPEEGKTVGKQAQLKVLALDNASLAELKAEYQRAGEDTWQTLAELQISGKSYWANIDWNTVRLTEGEYKIRITAADAAGNVSEEQLVTYYVDHTAPHVPKLTAETGHFEIKLTLEGEKASDFSYYEIYRRGVGESSFAHIATITENQFTDTNVETGIIYFYQVAVYDKYGNSAKTQPVECYADDVDEVAPIAVLSQNLMGLAGMEVAFDGMECSDNVRIIKYLWNMGDGTEEEGLQPVHIYQEAGTYTVMLQVWDAAGNTAQAMTTIEIQEKTGRGSSVVKVVDEGGNAIPYASIYVSSGNAEGYSLKANSSGLVTIVAKSGTYNVAAYANRYLPADIDVTVSEYEIREYTLTLVEDELIVGELTVHRMELEEMLEAGVDFSNPDNYNRFVFEIQLTFAQTPLPMQIEYVSGGGGAFYYMGGGSYERTVYIQDVDVHGNSDNDVEEEQVPILAYISTIQHISWLKEMYEVELGILNAAGSDYSIEDSVATLNLPESGVSLASVVGGQSLTQNMGTIRGQERKTVSWIIRGDESGTYSLSADFEGTLMPFRQKVSARFETESEFEVNTGEGIHIYVMPEKSAYIDREYYIQFKIVNESDRPLYKFSTSIGPYEEPVKEYTVIDCDTGERYTTTSVPFAVSTGTNLRQAVILEEGQKVEFAVLYPGEYFYGTYKTTFTGEGDPEKVYYRLIDSLVTMLEGENLGVEVTVLPIESHIYQTRYRMVVLPSFYGDPVDITNGYFTEEVEAFAVNGATSIGLDMHYNSGLAGYRGDLGFGWYHDYDMRLEEQNGIIWYYGSPGAKVSFLNQNALQNTVYGTVEDGVLYPAEGEEYSYGEYYSQSEAMEGYRIEKHEDGTYTMHLPNGIRYGFDIGGRLVKVTDTDGKSVSIGYSESTMTITDDLSGKHVYYNYNVLGLIASVSDDNGRVVTLTYDTRGCLSSYTDPIGNMVTYVYDEQHRIVEASNANGVYVANVYDDKNRVTEQLDARGGLIRFAYEDTEDGLVVNIVDAAGVKKQATMNANGKMTHVINENGGETTYVYDEKGRLLSEIDSYGNVTSREYDEKGNIIKLTESGTNSITMTYDANGNLLTVTDAEGNVASHTYDARNQMVSKTDYNGCVTNYEYDTNGFLVKETTVGLGSVQYVYENGKCVAVTDYKGNTSYVEYDGMGNLIKSMDAAGDITSYEFNAAGQMVRTIDSQGNETLYRYDCNFNVIEMIDSEGNITAYEYDAAGNKTAVCYPDGTRTVYVYDCMGRCTEVHFADGTKEYMEYDVSGNLTKEIFPDGSTVSYKYDLLNRCVEEQDVDGSCIFYEYYPNGKIFKETYPDGSSLQYTYNSSWYPETVTDHRGSSITYKYDLKGNVIEERDALGNTKRYSYDIFGRLTGETDANGNATTYEYDANSNCIKKTYALGASVNMKYDERNRLTEVYSETRDGGVYKISYEYDSLGRVVAVTDEAGNTSRMGYDALGNVTSVTDAKGNVQTVTTYDSMGRTATLTDALGITAEYSYDAVGNLLAVTELLNGQTGRVTGYTYDSMGRLIGVTDPLDGITAEVYNEKGELVGRMDANGGTTSYTYDCMGRLLTELNPIGSKTTYAYNEQGMLSELMNARGQKTAYAYDAVGRVTSVTDELGTVSYEYDANGNVLKVTDEGGSIERKYDALNRITEYTDYNGNTVKYAYDEIGNLISLTYPGGEIVRYTYYKNGWLKTATDNEGRVTSYEYDANGNITHTTRANGTEEFCVYNEAGLLVEQKDVKGEEVLTHYIYTYDARGNIATIEGTETAEGDLPRLVSATMTYDAANRLLTYNGEELCYDADGNMTYGPVNGVMTELVYDCRNRLVSAGGVTYTYDPENTRIAAETENYREVYVTESVSSSLSRILSVTRYEKTAGEETLDGVTTLYVYGNGLIYEYTDEKVLYHHYNNLGSTTKLTDAKGEVVETYTYGVYGELLSGDTSLTRFLYNGRCGVSTDDNGLYYMRQRYYNPEIKRFVNQDILTGSIGNSQSLNRYSYVQGNPVSYTDPFGLSPFNGLFSGTNLVHSLLGLVGWIPGPIGAVANGIDGVVYALADKDYKNAILSAGSAFTFGAGKVAAKVGKGSKTALRVQRVCNFAGSGINFAQSAEGTYQTASMMADKYIVQGQPFSGTTVLEFVLLAANVTGTYKSGTYAINDVVDGVRAVGRQYASWKEAKARSAGQSGNSDSYVYRALNQKDYERYTNGLGLEAKNPNGGWGLKEHLVDGSGKLSWANDPYISTTSNLSVAKGFNESGSGYGIVKIDMNKVTSPSYKGYEIYPRVNGKEGLPYHYSVWQQETSVYQRIPLEAIVDYFN